MDLIWFIIAILHLLPVIMVVITWKKAFPDATEKIVRAQVIATVVYLVFCPIAGILSWPNFQFSDINLGNIISFWHGDGLFNVYTIVSAAIVAAAAIFIRGKLKK